MTQKVGEGLFRVIGEIVVEQAKKKEGTYRLWFEMDGDSYVFLRLAEEVGELAQAMTGRHEHTPELEWLQIASIAVNHLAHADPQKVQDAYRVLWEKEKIT